MGHINCRDAGLGVDAPYLLAHFEPQPGVEVGERFVEQQHVRPDDQRSRQSHALLLAARELVRRAMGKPVHLHNRQGLGDPLFLFNRVHAAHVQSINHVLGDRHVRPERVVLKDHAGVAVMRRHASHRCVAKK